MKYIPTILSSEIKEKYDLINNADKSIISVSCKKLYGKAIMEDSRINSFRIEHPNLKVPFSIPKGKKRKFIKEGIENIKKAFEWGKNNFELNTLDEYFIKEIAGRITPELYAGEIAQYRERGTAISGASVTPPYPEKIRIEMPRLAESLKDRLVKRETLNIVGAAFYSHLHLARIHPFVDGNGRTARILQDVILDHFGFPLPIIKSGERSIYYEALDRAVFDWKHEKNSGKIKNGATKGEHLFYTFMAGKLNISLDKILDSCLDKYSK